MKRAPKHKRDKEELSFYKSVTPIVGDYIVKDVFRWLLSDKIKKVAYRIYEDLHQISNLISAVSLFM